MFYPPTLIIIQSIMIQQAKVKLRSWNLGAHSKFYNGIWQQEDSSPEAPGSYLSL